MTEETTTESDETTAFAQVSDLEDRWHTLTEAEKTKANALLSDATQLIKDMVPKWADIATATLKAIVCAMVKRAMLNDDGGITTQSQTTGPFSESFTYANPSGDLYLTKSEKQRLRGGSQTAFHIDLGGA